MVFQAYKSAGVEWLPDCGTGDILGYCESTHNTYDGKRYYAANCYELGPNVTIWTRTIAEKLIYEENKVTGVKVYRLGVDESGEKLKLKAFARKEVLICGGVQGSAKLLLLR
jgi:choline dehydrogenase-like flavoprotein